MSPLRPQPLGCAIIGLGRIGSLLEDDRLREKPATHAGAVARSRDCRLLAGCDIAGERRRRFARRWGCRAVYAALGPMLERHRPDILHVATPTGTHERIVTEACEGRVPLIVCEKPLAPAAAAAQRLVSRCAASGTVLMVNHERRYSRDYLHLRRTMAAGPLGELQSVTARVYMGRGQAPEEILLSDGTHMVDILRYLTGRELLPVTAARQEAAAGALAFLFRLGEAAGTLEVSGRFESLVFEIDLWFSRGRARIGNGLYEQWLSSESPYYERFRSLRRLRLPRFRRTGYFSGMLADAVRVLRRPGTEPRSSGRDGLEAVRTIERLLASLG